MKLLKSLGDRLLNVFMPQVKAGACVPEHGQSCGHYDCYGRCR